MERIEFTVHGEGAWTVPRAIRGFPKKRRADYDGDGFAVIVTESYYFRATYLVVVSIFELIEENAVKVTLVSGGGMDKWRQRLIRVKSTELNRVAGKIQDYCRENGLEIERE